MSKSFTFIIDFTYDGEKVTVLEMGDFFKSGVTGLDRLRKEKGQIPLAEAYRNNLCKRYPDAIYVEDRTSRLSSSVNFYDFSNNSQASCYFLEGHHLINLVYLRALLGARYLFEQPLVASLHGLAFSSEYRTSLANLLKEQKNTFDLLNYPEGVLIDACLDKVVFKQFADETDFCPPTILVNLEKINVDEIVQFMEKNSSSHFVIKPTNLNRGQGVEIVEKEELIDIIKELQVIVRGDPGSSTEALKSEKRELFAWARNSNPFLLLQTCCPSKKINYEGNNYYPTGRVVIEAIFDEDHSALPTLNFMGSYWKFPRTTAEDSISTPSLVSHVDDESKIAAIDENDWLNIEKQFQIHLPPILAKLYSTRFENLSNYFTGKPELERYQKVLKIDQIPALNLDKVMEAATHSFKDFRKGGYYPACSKEDLRHFQDTLCPHIPIRMEESKQTEKASKQPKITPGTPLFFKPIEKEETKEDQQLSQCCLM